MFVAKREGRGLNESVVGASTLALFTFAANIDDVGTTEMTRRRREAVGLCLAFSAAVFPV